MPVVRVTRDAPPRFAFEREVVRARDKLNAGFCKFASLSVLLRSGLKRCPVTFGNRRITFSKLMLRFRPRRFCDKQLEVRIQQ